MRTGRFAQAPQPLAGVVGHQRARTVDRHGQRHILIDGQLQMGQQPGGHFISQENEPAATKRQLIQPLACQVGGLAGIAPVFAKRAQKGRQLIHGSTHPRRAAFRQQQAVAPGLLVVQAAFEQEGVVRRAGPVQVKQGRSLIGFQNVHQHGDPDGGRPARRICRGRSGVLKDQSPVGATETEGIR